MRSIAVAVIMSLALASSAALAQQAGPGPAASPPPLPGPPPISSPTAGPADDGSTRTVKAVPCSPFARETDGTTTCIGISDRDSKPKGRRN